MTIFDIDLLAGANARFLDEMRSLLDRKETYEKEGLEAVCDNLFSNFCQANHFSLGVVVRFAHIHNFQDRMHSELCLVDFDGASVILTFPEHNLRDGRNARGLAFVLKSVVIIPILQIIAEKLVGRRVQFLFEVGDNGYLDAVSFCSKNNYSCLVPDFDFFTTGGYKAFRDLTEERFVAWEARVDKIFWRGSSTGIRESLPPPEGASDNLKWLQRLNLCVQGNSEKLRDYCDFGITNIVNVSEQHVVDRIVAANIIRPLVPKTRFMDFKGVVDVDGNSNAWSGLFCGLLTGACVLKVASTRHFRQWYYEDLVPRQNFLPVCSDLTDLPEAVHWMMRHDDLVKSIGVRGRELAKSITLEKALNSAAERLGEWLNDSIGVRFL